MKDKILIEDDVFETVVRIEIDDEEFSLKFYQHDDKAFSITLFPDIVVPMAKMIKKYLNQACFMDQHNGLFPNLERPDNE